jgi:peptidoglycan/xylan/chitin deacetylase (PgdA/CDA1 family)
MSRFGAPATFFLNGEFIRQNPDSAVAVGAAGFEAASMFYAPVDLNDARYAYTNDFIAKGLARNEDEYHRATGRELVLVWHPPYYAINGNAATAAWGAGYFTAGRTIDPMDWVTREDARQYSLTQYSAGDMVDMIADAAKDGAIIPIRLGALPGGRDTYLFTRLGLLLDALVRAGFELVPVSALVK